LISEPKKTRGATSSKSKAALRELGTHPEDDAPINIYDGPYGPYIKHGKTNVGLPEGTLVEDVTIATALELLSAKASTSKTTRKTSKTTTTKSKSTTKSSSTATKKKGA
jgi:DNA topoisomerase-1